MKKFLVVYFSATGATKRLAERLSRTLNADIFEIEPEVKYTSFDLIWPSKINRAYREMRNKNFRPLVARKLENIDEYDNILLGFPIWYNTAPTIVNTFLEENDLSGKNVYLFVTSGATKVDKSLKDLRSMYPDINFVGGKRFNGSFMNSELLTWIH